MNKRLWLVALFFAVTFCGCSWVNPLSYPKTPKGTALIAEYDHQKDVTVTPMMVLQDAAGTKYVANQIVSSEHINLMKTQPKVSFWVKFWGLFGFWSIAIIAIAIFVPGGAAVIGLLASRTASLMSAALTQTVKGVDNFLKSAQSEEEKKRLLTELSRKMDAETKVIVAKIKAE